MTRIINGVSVPDELLATMGGLYRWDTVLRATGTSDPSIGTGAGAHVEATCLITPLRTGGYVGQAWISMEWGSSGVGNGDGVWFVEGPPGIRPYTPLYVDGASSDLKGTCTAINDVVTVGRQHYHGISAVSTLFAALDRVDDNVHLTFVPVIGAGYGNGITEYLSFATPFNSSTATEHPWDAVTGAESWNAGDQLEISCPFLCLPTSRFDLLTPVSL